MPVYEYKCKKCETIFEVVQGIKEEPLKTCLDGKCGGELEKLISKSTFQLKGDCWAKNGYTKK